jgi:heterodisulfide reductase subunit B
MTLVSPVRNLAKAREGKQDIVLLCAFCYNVFRRTNRMVATDAEARQKINDFLREDVTDMYGGEVRSLHLLEVIRDDLGLEKVEGLVKKKLGLKVAPYYGCMLLRPDKEMELDDPEQPTVLHDLLSAMGAETIDFPYKTECCSSYITVSSPETTIGCSHSILNSAVRNGAEAVAVSCPLCFYNLDSRQKEIGEAYPEFKSLPIYYFTELLCLALGLPREECGLQDHYVDPIPLLEEKRIL